MLERIEQESGTGHKKWHKLRREPRLEYLERVLRERIAVDQVVYGCFEKPVPYFLPFIEVLDRGIKASGGDNYVARISVDGIDRQKAKELTNALRARGVMLKLVKSSRDESEPLIRLADMWAGCVRASFDGPGKERDLLDRAEAQGRIRRVV